MITLKIPLSDLVNAGGEASAQFLVNQRLQAVGIPVGVPVGRYGSSSPKTGTLRWFDDPETDTRVYEWRSVTEVPK